MIRDNSKDIAILGISCRFPGPRDLNKWWDALLRGEVLTTKFDKEELFKLGVPDFLINDPEYIPVRGYLADSDRFDNKLFRVSHRDAEMMDPQHRLMLEISWSALEDAGYGKSDDRPVTGVFASGSGSGYARSILSQGPLEPDLLEQVIHGTEPDFIASLISYKLNLTGPAVAVQTACSSSLVALHLACQALNNGDCELALVVAAGIAFPQGGHLHIPGGINSGSGICRPFDEKADGVVEGSGVACVVVKRLRDISSHDIDIHGVILGTAINNDGDSKAGYYAPSVTGQISVIQKALKNANVDATSIGYLEAHATGTHIGDPIEWTSTSEAYKELGAKKQQIAVGALKANIGHLDAASGLASIIKTIKVLKEGKVAPIANFQTLNPFMETEDSPLCIPNGREHRWPTNDLRRAAISAFGIGGTNAHIILEQAPQFKERETKEDNHIQLIQLSAADPEALNRSAKRLSDHLTNHNPNLKDVAYTLLNGRPELTKRLVVCGRTSKEVAKKLDDNQNIYRCSAPVTGQRPAIFLFTGQGSQRPGMANPLLKVLPEFSDNLETCLSYFEEGLKNILSKALLEDSFSEEKINQTEIAQPALFAMEYAIAKSLISMGIKPSAVAGHSLGEVTAAYFAGVFSLEDAVKFVTERGRSMQACPEGNMLAINANVTDLTNLLKNLSMELCITAVNTNDSCVLAGRKEDIEAFKNSLDKNTLSTILKTNRAFHSPLIEPALGYLKETLSTLKLNKIKTPISLNVTGQLYKTGHMLEPDYFLQQARKPVKFLDLLQTIQDSFNDPVFIEIGSGQILSSMVWSLDLDAIPIAPNHCQQDAESEIVASLGALWANGYAINLSTYCSGGKLLRLPTYPFWGPKWMAPEVKSALENNFANSRAQTHSNNDNKVDEFSVDKEKDIKNILSNIWIDVLSCKSINEDSDFFNLGGDSLLITSLIRKVNQTFNIKVPPRKMLSAKTLTGQVALIEEILAS